MLKEVQLMPLFNKKKDSSIPRENPVQQGPALNPVGIVQQMQNQGLTNNQIIQELQMQGYNSQQIFDALNASEPGNIQAGPIQQQMPQQQYSPPEMMDSPVSGEPQQNPFETRERIEEMAEAIIDEKWEELVKSINKIVEWKDRVENQITKIEQEIRDMKENFNRLHSAIIGKIDEYDKNIVNVGTEVRAMEKVFEKILPSFTENVNELRRIVKSTPSKKK